MIKVPTGSRAASPDRTYDAGNAEDSRRVESA